MPITKDEFKIRAQELAQLLIDNRRPALILEKLEAFKSVLEQADLHEELSQFLTGMVRLQVKALVYGTREISFDLGREIASYCRNNLNREVELAITEKLVVYYFSLVLRAGLLASSKAANFGPGFKHAIFKVVIDELKAGNPDPLMQALDFSTPLGSYFQNGDRYPIFSLVSANSLNIVRGLVGLKNTEEGREAILKILRTNFSDAKLIINLNLSVIRAPSETCRLDYLDLLLNLAKTEKPEGLLLLASLLQTIPITKEGSEVIPEPMYVALFYSFELIVPEKLKKAELVEKYIELLETLVKRNPELLTFVQSLSDPRVELGSSKTMKYPRDRSFVSLLLADLPERTDLLKRLTEGNLVAGAELAKIIGAAIDPAVKVEAVGASAAGAGTKLDDSSEDEDWRSSVTPGRGGLGGGIQ